MTSRTAAPSNPRPAPQAAGRESLTRIRLWGRPTLTLPGETPRPLERKLAAALALAASGEGRSRERVAGLLWPGSGDSTARTNLRVLLHRARDTLGVSLVAPGSGWSLAEDVHCDLADGGPDSLRKPLLDTFSFDDLEELRQVLDAIQASARRVAVDRSLTEAEQALTSGTRDGPLQAAARAQAVLSACPTDESACRLVMKAQVALGQRSAALAQYERLRQTLSEAFGTQPDRQTRLLQLDILRDQAPAALPATASPTDDARTDLLRTPQAVGRQAVIEQLLALGAQSRHAWLEGDAGVGKSRMVEELLLRTTAVRVRCRPGDGPKPYAVLRRLIGQIELERATDTQATMAELLKPDSDGAGIDLHDVFHGVVEALQRLRRDGVQQLVIEDVHYLDPASGRLVNELIDALTDDRALAEELPALVLTARLQHDNPTFGSLRQALKTDPNVQRITLKPLDAAETHVLVQALTPTLPWLGAPDLAQRLHAMSGGNAFFMLEIVRAACATPDPAALAVRVDSVQTLLARRLQDASAEALELASLLAVAQADFDPRMPRELLGQDGRVMARSWQELVGLGLFKSNGFAHDLALVATQEALVGPQAQLLHAQVAEFLERHGGTDDRVAHHGLRSHSPSRAVAPVLRYARAMSREGTLEPAIALVAEAERHVPGLEHTDDGFRLLAQLALWWTTDPQHRQDFVPAALRRLRAAARSPAQKLLAQTADWTAHRFKPLGDRDAAGELDALWRQPRLWPWWHWMAGLLISRLRTDEPGQGETLSARLDELLDGIEAEHDRWPDALLDLGQVAASLANLVTNDEQQRRAMALFARWEALAHHHAATGLANRLAMMSAHVGSVAEGRVAAVRRVEAVLPQFERRGVPAAARNSAREWLRFHAGKAAMLDVAWPARVAAARRGDPVAHPFVAAEADIFLAHALGDLEGAQALVPEHPAFKHPTSERQAEILVQLLWTMEQAAAQAEGRPLRSADAVYAGLPRPPDAQTVVRLVQSGAGLQAQAEAMLATTAIQASRLGHYSCRFQLMQAFLQQDRVDLARPLLDALWPPHAAWYAQDALTAPDSAHDLWIALVRCGHPEADAVRDTWRRWRDEQAAELPAEWRDSFRWRHAWVSDTPSPRPARVPRGPWVTG